jgi:hypothetical protein
VENQGKGVVLRSNLGHVLVRSHTLPSLSLAKWQPQKCVLRNYKPQSVVKVGKDFTLRKVVCTNDKVCQQPSTYQIAKLSLGKLWLGTKNPLLI